MVRKIFWEDSYQKETETTITAVEENGITVDRTVAFAYPGGQAFDTGTIGGFPINNAVYKDREIYYTLPAGHTLKTGCTVTMKIDWARRYELMKLHFAEELLIVLLRKQYDRKKLTRAEIYPERGFLDFEWDGDISEIFPFLKEEMDKLIAENHAITSAWLDKENEKRYWEIPGLAKVPCGGTHLKATGEIGKITLIRHMVCPGTEEIEVLVD
jgi:Ser-tRNA(Ala) deacylase AlaX